MPKVKVESVPGEQITAITTDLNLDEVFNRARPVPGCRKVHSFTHVDGKLHMAELSKHLNTAYTPLAHPAQARSVVPIPTVAPGPTADDIEPGHFVTVVHKKVMKNYAELSLMSKGLEACKWPRYPTTVQMPYGDIITKVEAPSPAPRRGRFLSLSPADIERTKEMVENI